MSSMGALWISHHENVEVISVTGNSNMKYADPQYLAKRRDGSMVTIERKDIILQEEETLIDELADILGRYSNPVRHERYSFIMHTLIRRGVPFLRKLENRMPPKQIQQSIPLSEVG